MSIRILVIDDEESTCEINKFNLEKEGYEVDCAYSAEEALGMDLTPYDLFIVDIMMERLSGFDFAKAIRNNSSTEEVPIIFCSALNSEDDTVMGLNIGADDYITKPYSISEMLARVNAVLRRSAIARKQAAAASPASETISSTEEVPIIFCSALNSEDDTVMGLNIGADDYITKPYSISEMLARVNAVLRRSAIARKQAAAASPASETIYEPQVTYRTLRIDPNEKICYLDDEKVALTKTEFEILSFFLTHPNRIYSREEIIRHVWSGDVVVTNRTIDTNITRLRKKIGRYGNNIETRLGFGYGFKEED